MFVIAKSGAGAKVIGPFLSFMEAATYLGQKELAGCTILPLEPADNQMLMQEYEEAAVFLFIDNLLKRNPEVANRKITVIKSVREQFGFGLKEAKDYCDKYFGGNSLAMRPGS